MTIAVKRMVRTPTAGLRTFTRKAIDLKRAESLWGQFTQLNNHGSVARTFTNATGKHHVGANGAVGAGLPRRSPVYVMPTLRMMADLIEPTRTNLLAPGTSERFNISWINNGPIVGTVTENYGVAPDGSTSTLLINRTSGGGTFYQGITALDATKYTFSAYIKGGAASSVGFLLDGVARSPTTTAAWTFPAGVPTLVNAVGSTFESLPGGWCRVSVTVLTVAAGILAAHFQPKVSNVDVEYWGACLELGAWPTSYISNRNLLLQSEDVSNAYYSTAGAGLTVTGAIADNHSGIGTCTRLQFTAASDGYRFRAVTQSGSTAARAFTLSGYMKSTGGADQSVRMEMAETGGASGSAAMVSTTQTVGASWARFSVTGSMVQNDRTACEIRFRSATGLPAADVRIDGLQLEYGTTATTYWATTTAVGLRAADSLTVDLSSIVDTRRNLLTYSEQFDHANWIKRGTAAATANSGTDPNGNGYCELMAGIGAIGVNDFYQFITATNTASYSPSFWIKRVTATGTLRIVNPTGVSFGDYTLDLSLLGAEWNLITASHASVTVVQPFVGSSNQCGMHFACSAGAPISFYLFGACLVPGTTPATATTYVATAATAQTANVTGMSNTAGTIIAIVRPYGWTGDQDGTTGWHAYRDADGTADIIMFRSSATAVEHRRGDGASSNSAVTTHGLTNGASRTFAQVWDATSHRVFINGTISGTSATVVPPLNAVVNLALGHTAGTLQISGEVLVLYIGRALSAADLLLLQKSLPVAA